MDVRIFYPDAHSYKEYSIESLIKRHESEKEGKYRQVCDSQNISFFPFVCSTDGVLGKKAELVLSQLADSILENGARLGDR